VVHRNFDTVGSLDKPARSIARTVIASALGVSIVTLEPGRSFGVHFPRWSVCTSHQRGVAPSGKRHPTVPALRSIVGVCGTPFKCPPAPSETALLLDELLRANGVRDDVRIQVVIPFGTPVPPSPATSEAILGKFAERGIEFVRDRWVAALDPTTHEAILDDGTRLPFDLFLGIPVHRAPAVVAASGLAEGGWIPVDKHTLATRFPGVYAVGDVTSVGTPKAGVFAEGAARVVADQLIARIRGESDPPGYDGTGACWMELGDEQVARIDVDFFSTPGHPTGTFTPPSPLMAAEKVEFGASRRARWFGRSAG